MRPSDFAQSSDQITFAGELGRKATHLGAMIVPGLYYYVFYLPAADPFDAKVRLLSILIPVTALAITMDVARLRNSSLWRWIEPLARPMVRRRESDGDFLGSTYILVAMCLTIAMFSATVASLALAFIIIGDTAAALVGRRWGRHVFRGKSLEGTLACLVSLAFVALYGDLFMKTPLWIGLTGAFVATLMEAAPDFVDDNLSVPLVSGLVMQLLTAPHS